MLADFSVKQRLHFLVPSVHGSCKLRTTKAIICYYFSTPRYILSVLLRFFFFTFISKRSCVVIVTLFEGFFTSTIVVFNLVYICAIKCVWCTKHFVWHSSVSEQLDFRWQVYWFVVGAAGSFDKLVLWFWITLTIFYKQLELILTFFLLKSF